MESGYRKKLFDKYDHTHSSYLNQNEEKVFRWTKRYILRNYLSHINNYDKESAKVLDIGCGRGYFLAGLQYFGYKNLFGVDLSPDDIERAMVFTPDIEFFSQDGREYLSTNKEQFDIILIKAVMEHIPKEEVMPFFDQITQGLKVGGVAIIDVPNMDWIFASHERYMDFTHEGGFTKESLRQVMNNCFNDVKILPGEHVLSNNPIIILKRFLGRMLLNTLLVWSEPDGIGNSLWSRSIIGIGYK